MKNLALNSKWVEEPFRDDEDSDDEEDPFTMV